GSPPVPEARTPLPSAVPEDDDSADDAKETKLMPKPSAAGIAPGASAAGPKQRPAPPPHRRPRPVIGLPPPHGAPPQATHRPPAEPGDDEKTLEQKPEQVEAGP